MVYIRLNQTKRKMVDMPLNQTKLNWIYNGWYAIKPNETKPNLQTSAKAISKTDSSLDIITILNEWKLKVKIVT